MICADYSIISSGETIVSSNGMENLWNFPVPLSFSIEMIEASLIDVRERATPKDSKSTSLHHYNKDPPKSQTKYRQEG